MGTRCYSSGMYLKHGRSTLPEYRCWQQIKQRCLNPDHRAYPNYGGRGITMASEWVDDFESFYAHVGPRPTPQHSLDRYPDKNGPYAPGNVRWATWGEQANNRRKHGTGATRVFAATGKRVTNFKHGLVHTLEYRAWSLMKDRCLNPNSSNYANWGGRGVTVYAPWIMDFLAFYTYVGPRPTAQHSLDRYPNPAGNYEPGNVRWATKLQQTQNRRPCKSGPDHGNFEHGKTGSPTYKTWGSVKTRCFNPRHDRYMDYGGRGITMCQRWRESFEAFLADLGPKPEGLTLARKDHGGSYTCGACPDCLAHGWRANCYWATKTEQNRSRKTTARTGLLTEEKVKAIWERLASGVTQRAVADEFGVNRSLIGKIARGEIWTQLPQWAGRGGDECA